MKKILSAALLLAALGALPGIVFAQGDEAQKEVDKQVAKAISDAISARVTTQVVEAAGTTSPPNNFWISGGRLTVESSAFDLAVPVVMGGWDRDIQGKRIAGGSLALSRFEDTIRVAGASVDMESTSLTFSPYVAFLLNPNYFATAKASIGFASFTTEQRITILGQTQTSESDTFQANYGVGGSFNALHRPGNFVLKGAAKLDLKAFSSSTTSSGGGSSSDSDSWVEYGFNGEAGLLISSRSYLFLAYEWSDTTQSGSEASSNITVGYQQELGRNKGLGVTYSQSLGGGDVDSTSFFVTFRMGF